MATPLLTVDLPGTGGRIRESPEDFVVEELPSYEPSGAGDHTFLLVEKRGLTTLDAARAISRAVGIPARGVGYAGLKDKWAVTRQTFSVEHVSLRRAAQALENVPGLRLLRATLHGNKLRLGHLRGNRFALRVRGVGEGAADRARAVLEQLRARGAPNSFGEQRFGLRGDNHEVGRELVRGDPEAALAVLLAPADGDAAPSGRTERRLRDELARGKDAARALAVLSRPILRIYVSAYQSYLFNRLLAERLDGRPDGLGTLEAGDLAFLHGKGAVFRVDDPAAEQPRADRLELSPSAPLFGLKTLLASGAPGERERELLGAEGIEPRQFRVSGIGRFQGARRPLRVPLEQPEVDDEGDTIVVRFSLPAGSYATTILREITK